MTCSCYIQVTSLFSITEGTGIGCSVVEFHGQVNGRCAVILKTRRHFVSHDSVLLAVEHTLETPPQSVLALRQPTSQTYPTSSRQCFSWTPQPPPEAQMSIFLDFDGTITVQDTIGEVANFALRVRADEGQDLARAWDGVVRSYLDDYRGHVDGYRVAETRRRCVDDEVAFLREMKAVELQSLVRIHECGVFRGIAPERFYEAGRRAVEVDGSVRLRPGFREFVQARAREGWRLWVVSVNWSAAFIAGALGCPEVTVIANTVRSDGSISGPDILNRNGEEKHRNLTNSCDKLAVVEAVLKQTEESLQGKPSFYFGDSITDLECLLRADRGVVISDKEDSTLLKTLGRIGKTVSHSTDAESQDSRLFWASDYNEIEKHVAFTL